MVETVMTADMVRKEERGAGREEQEDSMEVGEREQVEGKGEGDMAWGSSGQVETANTAVPSSGYSSAAATAAAATTTVAAAPAPGAASTPSADDDASFSAPATPVPAFAAPATAIGASPASSVGYATPPVPHATASGKWPAGIICSLLSA